MRKLDLSTLKRNLARAIANHETVEIGGGKFSGDELRDLMAAIVVAENWQWIEEFGIYGHAPSGYPRITIPVFAPKQVEHLMDAVHLKRSS